MAEKSSIVAIYDTHAEAEEVETAKEAGRLQNLFARRCIQCLRAPRQQTGSWLY